MQDETSHHQCTIYSTLTSPCRLCHSHRRIHLENSREIAHKGFVNQKKDRQQTWYAVKKRPYKCGNQTFGLLKSSHACSTARNARCAHVPVATALAFSADVYFHIPVKIIKFGGEVGKIWRRRTSWLLHCLTQNRLKVDFAPYRYANIALMQSNMSNLMNFLKCWCDVTKRILQSGKNWLRCSSFSELS